MQKKAIIVVYLLLLHSNMSNTSPCDPLGTSYTFGDLYEDMYNAFLPEKNHDDFEKSPWAVEVAPNGIPPRLTKKLEAVSDPEKRAALDHLVPKGILLAGEPGGGKTSIILHWIKKHRLPSMIVSASDFKVTYHGEGAKKVNMVFDRAAKIAAIKPITMESEQIKTALYLQNNLPEKVKQIVPRANKIAPITNNNITEKQKIDLIKDQIRYINKQAGLQTGLCVIVIDEIDAIGESRKKKFNQIQEGGQKEQLITILTRMNEHTKDNDHKIFLVGITNHAEALDDALISRFGAPIIMPLPGYDERTEILQHHLNRHPTFAYAGTSEDLRTFAQKTRGFSGRDLTKLVEDAAIEATNSLNTTNMSHYDTLPKIAITNEHINQALSGIKKDKAAAKVLEKETWEEWRKRVGDSVVTNVTINLTSSALSWLAITAATMTLDYVKDRYFPQTNNPGS